MIVLWQTARSAATPLAWTFITALLFQACAGPRVRAAPQKRANFVLVHQDDLSNELLIDSLTYRLGSVEVFKCDGAPSCRGQLAAAEVFQGIAEPGPAELQLEAKVLIDSRDHPLHGRRARVTGRYSIELAGKGKDRLRVRFYPVRGSLPGAGDALGPALEFSLERE